MDPIQAVLVMEIERLEDTKRKLKDISANIDELMKDIPIGTMFQDEDGVVYRIEKPTGTFVEYRDKGYVRTRREGEAKGSLSMKDAEAAGFKVK